jgi:DNA repair exonuclease SbcCD ATPase subunit
LGLYERQIEDLKAEKELYKQTQYDRAWALMESQKKLFKKERESLVEQIAKLESDDKRKDEELGRLQGKFESVNRELHKIKADEAELEATGMTGFCSPGVADSQGNVTIICQGVAPRALARLNQLLDQKDIDLQRKIEEAELWAKKYQELKQALEDGTHEQRPN